MLFELNNMKLSINVFLCIIKSYVLLQQFYLKLPQNFCKVYKIYYLVAFFYRVNWLSLGYKWAKLSWGCFA